MTGTQIIPPPATPFEPVGLNINGATAYALPAVGTQVPMIGWGQIMPIGATLATVSPDATPDIAAGTLTLNVTGRWRIGFNLDAGYLAGNPFVFEDIRVTLFVNGLSSALNRQVSSHPVLGYGGLAATWDVDPVSLIGSAGDILDLRISHQAGFTGFVGALTATVQGASFWVQRLR